MIVKNLTRKSGTEQLVKYLFKYFLEEKGISSLTHKDVPLIIKHNLRGNEIEGWVRQFNDNEKLRVHKRKNNVLIHHTIISFSDKDQKHITKSLLKEVTRKYVELRGKENIYLATPHYDKNHVHIHIAMSGCEYKTGLGNRISRQKFKDIKLKLDRFQRNRYPDLINSLPRHGHKSLLTFNEKDLQFGKRTGKISEKYMIVTCIKRCLVASKTMEDFIASLKTEQYKAYYRGGGIYGVENARGRRFRFKTLGLDISKFQFEKSRLAKEKLKEIQNIRDKGKVNVRAQEL